MLNSIAAYIISAAMTIMANSQSEASLVPDIYIDENRTVISELAYEENDTTFVPVKEMSEALGATDYKFNPDTLECTVEAEGLSLSAKAGDCYIVANGRYIYVPELVTEQSGALMVPISKLATAFGAEVYWDGEDTYITTGEPIESGDDFYDSTDLYWLSRIIQAEAGGECMEGKIAVGNVVLNRVECDEFPSTVKKVIFDKKYAVQFSPAYSGSIYNKPSGDSIIAAKLALDGANTAGDSLYFVAARSAKHCWAARNRELFGQIDNQVFFL